MGSDKCPNLYLQPCEESTLRLKIRMTEVRGTSQVTSGFVVVLSMRCPHGYWLKGVVVTVVVPEGTMSLSQMLPWSVNQRTTRVKWTSRGARVFAYKYPFHWSIECGTPKITIFTLVIALVFTAWAAILIRLRHKLNWL